MTTASQKLQNLRVVTSLMVDESNNDMDDATIETPQSGLFISPSVIAGRDPVTGFLVTAENTYGKLEFSDPTGFLSLDQLSDVVITSEATNNVLTYNGTNWVNVDDITLDSMTLTKVNEAQATNINTAVTITGGSNAGIITTQVATTAVNGSDTFTVNNANVAATSIVQVGLTSYAGAGIPYVTADNIGAGSFDVIIYNADSAAALDALMSLSYIVV